MSILGILRGFNWTPLLFGLVVIGAGYFLAYFSTNNESVSHVNHAVIWMLFIPAVLFGYLTLPSANEKYLYPRYSPLVRYICGSVGFIAGFALFFTTLTVIVIGTIGTSTKELSPQAVRFQTIEDIVFWISSAYLILYVWFIWIRYVVKEDTIVSLNGRFLYPGTRFALYPWRRYNIELIHRAFGCLENIPLTIHCKDGEFQIVFSTSFEVDIEANRTEATGLPFDTKKVFLEMKEKIIEHLTEGAKDLTLVQFIQFTKSERDALRYEVKGTPLIWNGKTAVAIRSLL